MIERDDTEEHSRLLKITGQNIVKDFSGSTPHCKHENVSVWVFIVAWLYGWPCQSVSWSVGCPSALVWTERSNKYWMTFRTLVVFFK